MKIKIVGVISLFLTGCNSIDNNETREVSSAFSLPVTFGDGTKGESFLIGEEGKVGYWSDLVK